MVVHPPANFVEIHKGLLQDLLVDKPHFTLQRVLKPKGDPVVRFVTQLHLKGLGDWSFPASFRLNQQGQRWKVDWRPAVIHPSLAPGLHFARTRVWPERAAILAADGTAITAVRQSVVVGVEPGKVKDRNKLVSALAANTGVDAASITSLIAQPGRADRFQPIAELTEARYQQVKPAIYDLPGVTFQRKSGRLPPSQDFARQTIGQVGEATQEILNKLGEPYLKGDQVGLSGIEKGMESTLAGRPSGEVRLLDAKGVAVSTLNRFPGMDAQAVKTTIDIKAQQASDAALAGISKPAAIVVLDSATGDIRAVTSHPSDSFNRAMAGKYPPGSTFKMVTTAALLQSGVGADTKVDCPKEASVGGRKFRNFEDESFGQITFRFAFVQSCNTAFANLVRPLSPEKLTDEAKLFGFDAPYDLPVDSFGGSFPDPSDATEKAAAAIGQAKVEASPMHMASVAAAVASGTWHAPRLLADKPGAEPKPIDPSVIKTLTEFMRAVVTDGTGKNARVPGMPVAGKTGTAEFGKSNPPQTHAWFVGFRGRWSFAVLVEGGGVARDVAAPLAAKLLIGLGQ